METSRAWWIYFWFLAAVSVSVLFSWRFDWLAAFNIAGSVTVLAGLWGYLERRRIGHRYVWCVVFALFAASLIYAAAYPFFLPPELRIIGIASVGVALLLTLPLVVALWRYAFRSPDLWANRRAA